ncbi:MAG: hypothetical protein HON98_02565 [Chloroflexi bacterium]|nr:hypothetical protein [Chloroflexota bacterium]MBT3668725.1 hypothetical protein [Chloroflexota bacterium]MBT4305426.1 hypothetical protein [Chloroflexota bacterium]MBT4533037.1 hypothetical protein [Chloroflexota bacterium]MBT4683233.1 hypothetical protein [Chloroflexota bacterium]
MEQVLYWLVGGVGVPLVNWIKQVFMLEGKAAMVLTAVISGVLAFVALFIHEQMTLTEITWATLAAVFGQVLASATLAYKLLLKGE